MDTFLANAERILETAECAGATGMGASEVTILVGPEGQLHLIAASDWPLESLRRERGAAVAYRVTRQGSGRVAVEGRSLSRSCKLAAESPAAVARRLLGAPGLSTMAWPAAPGSLTAICVFKTGAQGAAPCGR